MKIGKQKSLPSDYNVQMPRASRPTHNRLRVQLGLDPSAMLDGAIFAIEKTLLLYPDLNFPVVRWTTI
jgi:hypothetical protein